MVQDAPRSASWHPTCSRYWGRKHRAGGTQPAFDISFISTELRQAGYEPPNNPVIDTLALARRCYTFTSNSLGNVAQSLGIYTSGLHRALADATITWHVLKRFLWDLEARGITTLGDMLAEQGSLTSHRGGTLRQDAQACSWSGTDTALLPDLGPTAPCGASHACSYPPPYSLHRQRRTDDGACSAASQGDAALAGDISCRVLPATAGRARVLRLDRIVEMQVETVIA